MRWDLIEKFETIQRGRRATAVKSFSGEEDFFAEHFPGKPEVPAVLLIEMVAQTGGVLFGLGLGFSSEVILAKIDSARFDAVATPPCRLVVDAEIDGEREEGAWISGEVRLFAGGESPPQSVGGSVRTALCERISPRRLADASGGEGIAIAKVRLLLATVPSLVPQGASSGKIVFNDSFMKHYDVMNVARASEAAR